MGLYSITDGKGLRDLSGSFSKSLVPVRQGEKEFSHTFLAISQRSIGGVKVDKVCDTFLSKYDRHIMVPLLNQDGKSKCNHISIVLGDL